MALGPQLELGRIAIMILKGPARFLSVVNNTAYICRECYTPRPWHGTCLIGTNSMSDRGVTSMAPKLTTTPEQKIMYSPNFRWDIDLLLTQHTATRRNRTIPKICARMWFEVWFSIKLLRLGNRYVMSRRADRMCENVDSFECSRVKVCMWQKHGWPVSSRCHV